MNAAQRHAFDQAVRQVVAGDLDTLAAELAAVRRELASVERLGGQVTALEAIAGGGALPRRERITRAAELRTQGVSVRAIASALHTDRGTVARDLKQLGVPVPETISGLDGRTTRGPRPAP